MKKFIGMHLLVIIVASSLPVKYIKAASKNNNGKNDSLINIKESNANNDMVNVHNFESDIINKDKQRLDSNLGNNEKIANIDKTKKVEQLSNNNLNSKKDEYTKQNSNDNGTDNKKDNVAVTSSNVTQNDTSADQEMINEINNTEFVNLNDNKNIKSEAREKILDDFRKKLENSNKEIQKTKVENIDSDFAIIIEKRNQDKAKKEELKNIKNLDQEILDMANKPIEANQTKKTKETQKKSTEILNKETKKLEQQKQIKPIADNNKQQKINTKQNNRIQSNSNNSNVFDITDTNVNDEILYDKKFQNYVRDHNVKLDTKLNEKETIKLFVPQEKRMVNFETDDIPDELISDVRSDDNRHIPHILTANDFKNTATKAINENNLDTVRGIVELTKNPNYILVNGQTMLNYAASLGNLEITRYLIFNGANLNTMNLYGNTALHNAILKNNMDIIKLLVQNNASLEIFNVDGYTPLMLSIVEGRNDITLYLLKFNQNLMLKNHRNETVLDIAIKYHRLVIKELILEIIARENE